MARDSKGDLIEAIAQGRDGSILPEVAEAVGIKEALSWIKLMGWSCVEVESDYILAVQSIRSSSSLCSYFGRIIFECRTLLYELKSNLVTLYFVKRSANTAAHFLARQTCIVSYRVIGVSETPYEFASILLQYSINQ